MNDAVWALAARHGAGHQPGRGAAARRTAKRGCARARVALLGVGVVAAAAGCSQDEAPVPVDLAWEAPPGGELVCGMDAVAVETAISLPVGAVEGGVTIKDDGAEGRCDVEAGAESTLDGSMLTVEVLSATSDEGLKRRAEVLGDAPGVREPEVRYVDAEGGVWFEDLGTGGGQTTLGGLSVVLVDDYVVALTSRRNDPERDAAEDLLALSQQVPATYGLVDEQQ